IDKLCIIQKQQEYTIKNLLSSIEHLTNKINTLSQAESQQELVDETSKTSIASQQRPTTQFENDKEQKNALWKQKKQEAEKEKKIEEEEETEEEKTKEEETEKEEEINKKKKGKKQPLISLIKTSKVKRKKK
ncbi:5194_t:CDS:2, partial [Dentiscutata heterogama]